MTAVPLLSWEQAGIVTLFAFFVIAILGWVAKTMKDNQSNYEKQSSNWQDFIEKRDERYMQNQKDADNRWQGFIEAQRKRDNDALCDVTGAIEKMTAQIAVMADRLEKHDTTLEPRVEKLIERVSNGKKEKG